MRKTLLIIGLLALVLMINGCPKKTAPPIADEGPVVQVDTTPPPPPPPPPPTPPPTPVVNETDFVTVYFDFDKYNVRADQKANIDKNAKVMREFSKAVIKIEGHCDERGTVEYNLALGDKRANTVKEYLIQLGIAPERIQTISYGKERPVDPGHSEAAWGKNRRAQFRIVKK